MPRVTSDQIVKANARWREISANLSQIISQIAKDRGVSINKLANEIGYSQGALWDVLSPRKERVWSTTMLLLMEEYLEVPLWQLIQAAQSDKEVSWLALQIGKTPPQTMDRLQAIIQLIAPKGTDETVLNLYYTANLFAAVCPDITDAYIDGRASDEQLYRFLVEVSDDLATEDTLWGLAQERQEDFMNMLDR